METVPRRTRPPDEIVGENAPWLVGFGLLRVLVGVLAMAVPFISGMAASIVVGALLFVTGVAHLAQAFRAEKWGAGVLGFVEGGLAIIAGLLIFFFPVAGVAALSIIAMAFLLVDGAVKIAM